MGDVEVDRFSNFYIFCMAAVLVGVALVYVVETNLIRITCTV